MEAAAGTLEIWSIGHGDLSLERFIVVRGGAQGELLADVEDVPGGLFELSCSS